MKFANEIVLIMNEIGPFSFASSFAEIKTYKKPTNAVFQSISCKYHRFLLASSFAETQASANKRKPVYQLVNVIIILFLCKPSLQKP